jgi:hypothetical protein
MKRTVIFLALTAGATVIIAALFGVIVCAPEPWQDRPWTLWERCAQGLFLILGWPVTLGTLLLNLVAKGIPDAVSKPIFLFLFMASGAFWTSMAKLAWNKWRRTPNHTSGIRQPADGLPKPSM